MSKRPNWLISALSSLDWFEKNPEYFKEFRHEYFVNQCGVTRQTLNRNEEYMARFREVKERLKSSKNPAAHRSTGLDAMKLRNSELRQQLKEKEAEISSLQSRLNECYLMLEDNGIDPEFVYPKRRLKNRQA